MSQMPFLSDICMVTTHLDDWTPQRAAVVLGCLILIRMIIGIIVILYAAPVFIDRMEIKQPMQCTNSFCREHGISTIDLSFGSQKRV
jgi:hypothetical protein